MTEIASVVSSVGFPIAAFILLFYYMKTTMEELRKTIEQNTLAVSKLMVYMETVERSEIDGKR